jgi:hypothetical protein
MNENFRINSNFSGETRDGGQSGAGKKGRLARFRRGRRKGELVSGIFVSLEPLSPGTAWVDFEGDKLLALLPEGWAEPAGRIFDGRDARADSGGAGEGDFPLQPGNLCFFVLEELEPELVLRMLRPEEQIRVGKEKPALFEACLNSISAMPPAQLISRYAGLCARMDSLLRKCRWPDRVFPCRDAYVDYIQKEKEALDIYTRLTLYRSAVVRGLKGNGLADLLYLPWLYPGAGCIHMAVLTEKWNRRTSGGPAFILQAMYSSGQRVQIRGELGQKNPGAEQRFMVQTEQSAGREDIFSILLAMYPKEQQGGFSLRA